MTAPGHSKGRRALAALAEIARDNVRPPSPAELDSGLDGVRARLYAEQAKRVLRPASRSAVHHHGIRKRLVSNFGGVRNH